MSSLKLKATGAAALVYLIGLILAVGGYIANIVGIVHSVGDPITTMFIARCVGTVVFPLGALLGFF